MMLLAAEVARYRWLAQPLTSLVARICPFIFFTFLSFLKKYLQDVALHEQEHPGTTICVK